MRRQVQFRWPAQRERGGQDAFSTLAPIRGQPRSFQRVSEAITAMAQEPGTSIAVRSDLPHQSPAAFLRPRRRGILAGIGTRPRSPAGDPMTLGNMRANGVRSLDV
jgi:hypothetical protein